MRTLVALTEQEKTALRKKYDPIQPELYVCDDFGIFLKADGTGEAVGENAPRQREKGYKSYQPAKWQNIRAVSSAGSHIAALREDGTVVACGRNQLGQCEVEKWRAVCRIMTGESYTAGITEKGELLFAGAFLPRQPVQVESTPDTESVFSEEIEQLKTSALKYKQENDRLQSENSALRLQIATMEDQLKKVRESVTAVPKIETATSPAENTGTVQETPVEEFTFQKTRQNTVTILSYIGMSKNVIVPGHIDNCPVTAIGKAAFKYCETLESVTLPDTVTAISEDAFLWCKSLKEMQLPDSVQSIGEYAFRRCEKLKAITLPQSVTYIGGGAFKYCGSLTGVQLPSHITEIHEDTFACCTELKDITIPEGVVSIGGGAFQACEKLKSISIPDSVISIGEQAMHLCRDVIIKAGNNSYAHQYAIKQKIQFSPVARQKSPAETMGTSADRTKPPFRFRENDLFMILEKYNGNQTDVIVPSRYDNGKQVEVIGEDAFAFSEIRTIRLPEELRKIQKGAFRHCQNLQSVTLPDRVTFIGDNAFRECTALKSIVIPASVKTIEGWPFAGCKNLRIRTPKNSAAYRYAKLKRIPVTAI